MTLQRTTQSDVPAHGPRAKNVSIAAVLQQIIPQRFATRASSRLPETDFFGWAASKILRQANAQKNPDKPNRTCMSAACFFLTDLKECHYP